MHGYAAVYISQGPADVNTQQHWPASRGCLMSISTKITHQRHSSTIIMIGCL